MAERLPKSVALPVCTNKFLTSVCRQRFERTSVSPVAAIRTMKLKCRPEDFVVTEELNVSASQGEYALYRLQKTDLGTLEAVQQISRTWNLPARRIAHAGLKDRRAVTQQSITIRHGPRADLQQKRFSLTYVGQMEGPLSAAGLRGNRFQIVVRQLSAQHAASIVERATGLQACVVPNYFDEQRFGSLGESGEYVAAAWCRRDYERATWLALAEANRRDRTDEKAEKRILREHWGDWSACKQLLSRSHRRSIVTYLVDHPTGFRRAFGLIRPDLRGIWLAALQSAVWNRVLGESIRRRQPDSRTTTIADSELPFDQVSPEVTAAIGETIPLISARQRNLSGDLETLACAATSAYGLRPDQLKVAWPRDRFFSRGTRRCWLSASRAAAEAHSDEVYSGYQSVRLDFELPPGCYATMLIRGLTACDTNEHR